MHVAQGSSFECRIVVDIFAVGREIEESGVESCFVEAFLQATAPILYDSEQTVIQAFHILNNFDIPIGMQFADVELAPDMHSATQITTATDLVNRRFYFRTMYNASVRCIDVQRIDFDQLVYQAEYLEHSTQEPIEYIEIY